MTAPSAGNHEDAQVNAFEEGGKERKKRERERKGEDVSEDE